MPRFSIVFLSFVLLSAPAWAEIYKCLQPNGKTEITNRPCPAGSSTVTSRPDEAVSESARRQAERDVERMREYVERREAANREKAAAEREERAASQRRSNNLEPPPSAVPPPSQYGSAEDCLHDVEGMTLEAAQRARMEAECRAIVRPQQTYTPPVVVPSYPQHLPHRPDPQPVPKSDPPSAPKITIQPEKK